MGVLKIFWASLTPSSLVGPAWAHHGRAAGVAAPGHQRREDHAGVLQLRRVERGGDEHEARHLARKVPGWPKSCKLAHGSCGNTAVKG